MFSNISINHVYFNTNITHIEYKVMNLTDYSCTIFIFHKVSTIMNNNNSYLNT